MKTEQPTSSDALLAIRQTFRFPETLMESSDEMLRDAILTSYMVCLPVAYPVPSQEGATPQYVEVTTMDRQLADLYIAASKLPEELSYLHPVFNYSVVALRQRRSQAAFSRLTQTSDLTLIEKAQLEKYLSDSDRNFYKFLITRHSVSGTYADIAKTLEPLREKEQQLFFHQRNEAAILRDTIRQGVFSSLRDYEARIMFSTSFAADLATDDTLLTQYMILCRIKASPIGQLLLHHPTLFWEVTSAYNLRQWERRMKENDRGTIFGTIDDIRKFQRNYGENADLLAAYARLTGVVVKTDLRLLARTTIGYLTQQETDEDYLPLMRSLDAQLSPA